MRERRALEQLAVAVAVALWRLDLARRVKGQVQLIVSGPEAVDGAARDHYVVVLAVAQRAERRLELARSLVHEDHLVALAVLVERLLLRGGTADRDLHVVVPHQQPPPADRVPLRGDGARIDQAPGVGVGDPFLPLDRRELAHLLDSARALEVIEDRLVAREALVAHDLLGQQRAVLAQRRVALPRDLTPALVPHRFPLLSCSRSMASNRALKLPSRKPRAP